MRDRLALRTAILEEKMAEAVRDLEPGALKQDEIENFYRVMGAFKGLSESGIVYSTAAERIDWKAWKEERF